MATVADHYLDGMKTHLAETRQRVETLREAAEMLRKHTPSERLWNDDYRAGWAAAVAGLDTIAKSAQGSVDSYQSNIDAYRGGSDG